MAVKSIITLLRKLKAAENANWVESLSRVLRLQHDMVGEAGLSPYEIVFGRERNLPGIPSQAVRWSEEAHAYMERMNARDGRIAALLNAKHARAQAYANASRRSGTGFEVGQFVWVVRPRSVGGCKTNTWWLGPARVLAQSGESSYKVELKPGECLDVHLDQLKPCFEPPTPPSGIPLFTSTASARLVTPRIVKVSMHSMGNTNQPEFLVHWENTQNSLDTWEDLPCCLSLGLSAWLNYCRLHHLSFPLESMEVDPPPLIPTEVEGIHDSDSC